MIRYLRLYAHFVAFSFSRGFEFRVDFFTRIFMDITFYAVNIAFFKIIFQHTSLLANWNEGQVMVFVSGYLLVDAFVMAIFADNLFFLPTYILKGELDYYLVRPVSSLFFLSLRSFSASSFVNILIALGFVAWTTTTYSEMLIPQRIPIYILLVLNGACIHYMIVMFFNIIVFWTHSGRGFTHLAWNMNAFSERPDAIYTGGIRTVLTTVLPYGLVASFPARYLFGEGNGGLLIHIAIVTVGLFYIMTRFWQWGLRNYSSASS